MGPVVGVREDASLRDVARVMLERPAQAVVVVDGAGEVRGVVTDRQLTLNRAMLRLASIKVPQLNGTWVTPNDALEATCVAAETVTAAEVMETRLSSASADEPVGAVVARMLEREAEYAVVRRQGFLVGMLSVHELLRMLAGSPELPVATVAPNDQQAGPAAPAVVGGWRWPHRGWLGRASR
jgi:CBS domain-containing protein